MLLGGGWNTGKSSSAVLLATQLGVANVIHTDVLRSSLRAIAVTESRDCLNTSSYETWRCKAKSFSPTALREGFLEQCRAIYPAARKNLEDAYESGKDTIIEGIHLYPPLYADIAARLNGVFVWLVRDNALSAKSLAARCASNYRRRDPQKYRRRNRNVQIENLNSQLELAAKQLGLPLLNLHELEGRRRLGKLLVSFFQGWC